MRASIHGADVTDGLAVGVGESPKGAVGTAGACVKSIRGGVCAGGTRRTSRSPSASISAYPFAASQMQYARSLLPSGEMELSKQSVQEVELKSGEKVLTGQKRHLISKDTGSFFEPSRITGRAWTTQSTIEPGIARTRGDSGGGGRGIGVVWTVGACQHSVIFDILVRSSSTGLAYTKVHTHFDVALVTHTVDECVGGRGRLSVGVSCHTCRLTSEVLVGVRSTSGACGLNEARFRGVFL